MNQKCSIQECSKDAVKFCNCQNKQIYYCEIHIKFHEKDKNHIVTSISPIKQAKTISAEDAKKSEILKLSQKKLFRISLLKKKIIQSSDELIKLIYDISNSYIKKLSKDEKELKDISFKIANSMRINKEQNFSFVENLKVKKFISNDLFFPQLCQSVKNYFSMNLGNEVLILNGSIPNTCDNQALFGCNGLNILDLTTNKKSLVKSFPKFLPTYASVCRVNNDTYFINGLFSIDTHNFF